MKTLFLQTFSMLLLTCSGAIAQEKANVSATPNTPTTDEMGKFWIHWATYKEWGHLPGCGGWGLCDYQDCWFCDVADRHRAKVVVDKQTKSGEMLIELDPARADEKAAISQKLDLKVVEDIDRPNSVLSKGNYPFDGTVGKNGGYRLKIRLK